ncbi:MAG TPA: GDP-mannose 4,6-dehydratase [Rhodanobacteraceae bacterium]|nr:GDP-mannose 4,6-dehydratase [Rhodanobacteraceae bacterium]
MNRPCKHALITGVSGQDGALLATHLLRAGVAVSGTHRPGRVPDLWRLVELGIADSPRLQMHALDVTDTDACRRLVGELGADAIFHLAGRTRVAESFVDPLASVAANGWSTLNLLEALRSETPAAHFVLAASAEIFGAPDREPQDEATAPAPRTPYGLSKLLAHAAVASWRASFGIVASSAILFNHESELRDPAFVTRKISRAVARIALGRGETLILGNLDARRDFGYAPDYVAALATLGTRTQGEDFVLASGQAASIREFAGHAFAAIDIALDWRGRGIDEVAIERNGGRVLVRVDRALLRPVDAPSLLGDATRARRELGFAATLDVAGLARRMVLADIARERRTGPDPSVAR